MPFYFIFSIFVNTVTSMPNISKSVWGMENSMEGGIFGLEIPRRGLKILTKCWKFHGRGVNSVGNSMGGR